MREKARERERLDHRGRNRENDLTQTEEQKFFGARKDTRDRRQTDRQTEIRFIKVVQWKYSYVIRPMTHVHTQTDTVENRRYKYFTR